ncbi:MAG: sigma 54-interacting transcriptional regulator [Myxococcota bacterium]
MAEREDFFLLIVDDEPANIEPLKLIFERQGYAVIDALSGEEGLNLIRNRPVAVALVDYKMPKMSGLDFLRAVEHISPDTVVIIVTAFGDIEVAVTAMKEGAYDYLTKPINKSTILRTVERAFEKFNLKLENLRLRNELDKLRHSTGAPLFLGRSDAVKKLMETAALAAKSDVTVLILGESGVGKEVLARTIHSFSERKDKPFVVVNCAALPEGILEGELFGYEKGAFTGALKQRIGYLERANGGTLLLDEIGDIPTSVQVRFLRFLQEGEIERLGGASPIALDVRVIAATSRNLKQKVSDGSFREDLFYRLNVFPLTIPPLRERPEDISLLAMHFIEKYNADSKYPAKGFTKEALQLLLAHRFDGNVRELENIIQRTLLLCKSEEIGVEHLPPELREGEKTPQKHLIVPIGTPLEKVEEMLIRKTLEYTKDDKQLASQLLGLNRRTIYRKLRSYGEHFDDENDN